MTAGTGAQYLTGLRHDREVWIGAERITDVTSHPTFAGSLKSLACLYDWQHRHATDCLTTNPNSGDLMSVSHLIPRGPRDLRQRHSFFERIARYSMACSAAPRTT